MITKKPISLTLKIAGLAATASLASLFVSPQANASSLIFSDSASFTDELTDLEANDVVLDLDKYSGVEAIDKIVITLEGILTSNGHVGNNASQSISFSADTKVNNFSFAPISGAPSALNTLNIGFNTDVIGSESYNLVSGATATFGPSSLSGTTTLILTDSAQIAQFLGAGTFSLTPITSILSNVYGGGGNIYADISTTAGGNATVAYYGGQKVPEPSIILGSLMMAGLGLASTRRKSQQTNIAE